jgi:hypothetical protein
MNDVHQTALTINHTSRNVNTSNKSDNISNINTIVSMSENKLEMELKEIKKKNAAMGDVPNSIAMDQSRSTPSILPCFNNEKEEDSDDDDDNDA